MKQRPHSSVLPYYPGQAFKKKWGIICGDWPLCCVLVLETSSILTTVNLLLTRTPWVWYECPRCTDEWAQVQSSFQHAAWAREVPGPHELHRNDLTKKVIILCVVHNKNRFKGYWSFLLVLRWVLSLHKRTHTFVYHLYLSSLQKRYKVNLPGLIRFRQYEQHTLLSRTPCIFKNRTLHWKPGGCEVFSVLFFIIA